MLNFYTVLQISSYLNVFTIAMYKIYIYILYIVCTHLLLSHIRNFTKNKIFVIEIVHVIIKKNVISPIFNSYHI